MGWKPRRRWYSCRKRRIKRRLVLGVLVLLIAVFAAGAWLNAWVEPQLQVIARQQTGIALNNIVQKVISTLDYDVEELVRQRDL